MIVYEPGLTGLRPICGCRGSVFHKAFMITLPCLAFTSALHVMLRTRSGEQLREDIADTAHIWSGYTSVLGFVIVFRNNQAYLRFWEGVTLINQCRGQWFNAASAIISFCSSDVENAESVAHLQHKLVRLFSILYCSALQQVCALEDDSLEIFNISTMDEECLDLLGRAHNKCELVVQWIQRLVLEGSTSNTLSAPAPVLTRAFQDLGAGMSRPHAATRLLGAHE